MPTNELLKRQFPNGFDSGDILAPEDARRLTQEEAIGGSYQEVFRAAILPYVQHDSTVLELDARVNYWDPNTTADLDAADPLKPMDSYTIYASFENIGGLIERSKVTVAGVAVGRVTGITLDKDELSSIVEMSIDTQYDQFTTDTAAAILTAGFFFGGGNILA